MVWPELDFTGLDGFQFKYQGRLYLEKVTYDTYVNVLLFEDGRRYVSVGGARGLRRPTDCSPLILVLGPYGRRLSLKDRKGKKRAPGLFILFLNSLLREMSTEAALLELVFISVGPAG